MAETHALQRTVLCAPKVSVGGPASFLVPASARARPQSPDFRLSRACCLPLRSLPRPRVTGTSAGRQAGREGEEGARRRERSAVGAQGPARCLSCVRSLRAPGAGARPREPRRGSAGSPPAPARRRARPWPSGPALARCSDVGSSLRSRVGLRALSCSATPSGMPGCARRSRLRPQPSPALVTEC